MGKVGILGGGNRSLDMGKYRYGKIENLFFE